MTTETPDTTLARREAPELTPYEIMERVITNGDLSKMSAEDRLAFYWRTCESLGLNPLTRPFDFIRDREGRLTMYARKDATDQLRRINGVGVIRLDRDRQDDLAMVTAYGRDRSKREDSAIGAVSIAGLRGEALANAWMKAETKAKRRMTLSLVGLGFLDETEVDSVGTPVDLDPETGELRDGEERAQQPASLLAAVQAQTEKLAPPPAETRAEAGVATAEAVVPEEPKPVEPEKPIELLKEPMTEAESAKFSVVDDEPDEPEQAAVEEEEAQLLAEVEAAKPPAPPGLTVQALADLARAAGIGKLRFASVLDCVPADVGARIEAMDDEGRHAVALALGIVS